MGGQLDPPGSGRLTCKLLHKNRSLPQVIKSIWNLCNFCFFPIEGGGG